MIRFVALPVLLLCAGLVRADIQPPDPDMELDDVSSGSLPVGTIFNFMSNSTGGSGTASNPVISLQNTSGADWIGLTITAPWPGGVFNCPQTLFTGAFAFCNGAISSDGKSITITFSGTGDVDPGGNILQNHAFGPDPDGDSDFFHGIPAGQHFTIDLNNPGTPGVGGWVSNALFGATATVAVPEPTSVALGAFSIVAALVIGRSRRRRNS